MPRRSRRYLLATFGTIAITLATRPVSLIAGLLDTLLGQKQAQLTKPITPNEEFYLTSYRSPPTIRMNEWSLSIKGLVERPMTLTYEQLVAMPTVSQIITLECVGNTVAGEFLSTAEWGGVSLRELFEEAGASATAYDVMIAHRMNGVPLPLGHGFPARAIVPGCYGMKSVQWLTEIEVVDQDYKGYYAQKGWTDEAIVKTTSRIDVPGHGSTLQGRRHQIQGLAFAGTRGISLVEVSMDGGERWMPATLALPLSPAAWRFWSYDWQAPASGRYQLIVRATDGIGRIQTSIEQDPAPDGATGLHEITVTTEI